MKVYQGLEQFKALPHAVVTIGTFDGVHAGHQKIISRISELATAKEGESVLLTFYPHPRMVLQPDDNDLKLITTMNERIDLLRHYGVQHLIVQPFDKNFSRLTAHEFVRDVLVNKIGTKTLVIGYDHHFGRNREGSYKDLEAMAPVYDYSLEQIPEQDINFVAVSSTKVREALLDGKIHLANQLMGHSFTLQGTVMLGDQLGRTLGFPTANIGINDQFKLIPPDGIYTVKVNVGEENYDGMLYIGKRPALNGHDLRIEVNIFDFDKDIYHQFISVSLVDRIRGDMNFDSLESLQNRMKQDKIAATNMLRQR